MTGALLRKELRDLGPWGVLSLAAGLLAVVPHLLTPVDKLGPRLSHIRRGYERPSGDVCIDG